MATKKIGAKIVIDGEQEFRQALLQSKNAMKEFDSEMKLVTAQFKNNEKSMESLKSKQAVYQKQQQELTKQSKLLVEQIQKASVEYNKASAAQEKQAEKIKQLEKALEKAKKEYGDSADEVQQLERELSEANAEYDKQQRSIDQLSNKITKWNTDLNKTQTELVETDRALNDTNDAIEHYDENMENAEQETRKFGIVMGESAKHTESLRVSLGSLVSAQVVVDVLRNCARAINEVASAAIEVGMKFDASMSNVAALSGATGETLDRLGEKAREMGAKTIYSASESADAFSYMALAGWNAEQMLEGIEPVLNLAASANMDLAEASDIVTDYITAFGLKAEDAAHFSDAMARAMSTSNTTVQLLGESYKNCAATCGAMGIEMEDATAVLATMANAGVKGGEAGTALNAILTRLATNTKGAADSLKEYGIDVYDKVTGNMNSLSSILNGLGNVWGDLSDKEQAALAKTIAGVSHYSKFQTIMLGVSEAAKEGGMSFDDYAASLRDCEGAAEDMAKVMQDNLQGDITILKSALEGLGIATEGVFDASFREAVQGATDAVSRLERAVSNGDLGVSLAAMGDAIGMMTENLVDAAEEGLPGFIDGITFLISNLDKVPAIVEGVVGALLAYKVATIASTIATEGFTIAIEANPIGLLAAGIVAAGIALKEYSDEAVEAANETSGQTKVTEELVETVNKFNSEAKDLVSTYKDQTSAMDAQAETAHKLVAELFDANTSESRLKEAVAELKSIYPDLNAAIDEHGKLIGATKEQMDQYIDSSLKMAKVEAAKEHLTEIAEKQFEAEQKLAEQEKNLAKQSEEVARAQEKFNAVAKDGDSIFTAFSDDLYESRNALNQAKEGFSEAEQGISDTKDTITELGDEYQRTLDYISQNEVIDEATESMNALGGSIEETSWITEDLQKEFEDLEKSISDSIASSLDLTNRWSQEWSTSTDEMTKNVQSQIEGVEQWAENFDKLANNSKVAIDENVMKYLAEMGTEGAGLVQQLVDELEKSPEKLQNFSDTMAEYLSVQSEVSASITDSYVQVMEDSMTGAADAIRENADLVKDAASETLIEGLQAAGEDAATAVAEGLEKNTESVSTAANSVGEAAVKGVTSKTGENGEELKAIGEKSDKALAEGFETGSAKETAEGISEDIYNAFAQRLSESSGNEIGSNFMSGLANAVDELGQSVLEAARRIAEEAKDILNSPLNNPPGNNPPGNNPPGHADGLAYVPYDNYLARLHEGERVLTKKENREYSALIGSINNPSFDAMESRLADGSEGRAVIINNDITVDGTQDPEAWTQTFIRTLKREARMV